VGGRKVRQPGWQASGLAAQAEETALANMLESWGKHGPDVLDRLAKDDPATMRGLRSA